MKRLHKATLFLLVIGVCSLLCGQIKTLAMRESSSAGIYNLDGEKEEVISVQISDLLIQDEGCWVEERNPSALIDVPEEILNNAGEEDKFIYMDMKTDNPENLYPQIEPTFAKVMLPQATGNIRKLLGKNYRLYYAENADAELVDISDKITDKSETSPEFALDKLGIYILFFNPKVYNVTFYSEEPIYEDGSWVNQDCIYEQITDLEYTDIIKFPVPPEKEGYVFTGWKAQHFVGGGGGNPIKYTIPQPVKVSAHREFFATWVLEDEYEPINIEISSSEPIVKGKEDGSKIALTTNYSTFVNDEDFPAEWRTAYDAETDEQRKASILSEWKSKWNIVGTDELIIESAERINDTTVELTLSGNSEDKYSNTDIFIEFDHTLLVSSWDAGKIKMDEDGVRMKMYRSDNALTLTKQPRPNTGGGTIRYTVKFDSNGGSSVSNQTALKNTTIKEPEAPQKEDCIFAGWFVDEELTTPFDFSSKIANSFTLYAKWNIADKLKPEENKLNYDDALKELQHANIIITRPVDKPFNNLYDDAQVTRAEFSKIVLNILREEVIPMTEKTYFQDCDIKDWYTPYINRLYELKIVSGYGNDNFKPKNIVTNFEAIAMLVRCLGYDDIKTENEAFPYKYLEIAEKLNLFENTTINKTFDKPITNGNMFVLLVNTMSSNTYGSTQKLWDYDL